MFQRRSFLHDSNRATPCTHVRQVISTICAFECFECMLSSSLNLSQIEKARPRIIWALSNVTSPSMIASTSEYASSAFPRLLSAIQIAHVVVGSRKTFRITKFNLNFKGFFRAKKHYRFALVSLQYLLVNQEFQRKSLEDSHL